MNRFILPLILWGSFTFAAEVAVPGGKPADPKGSAKQDAKDLACVSEIAIKTYSTSSVVEKMTRHPLKVNPPIRHGSPAKDKKRGYSLLAVRLNLKANGLLIKTSVDDADSYYDDDSEVAQVDMPAIPGQMAPPRKAKDAGPWLYNNGFVNLLDCPEYSKTMLNPKNLPKGAVIVYDGGEDGHIEIKTASGFWSDQPRTGEGFAPNRKVIGVYIKPMY